MVMKMDEYGEPQYLNINYLGYILYSGVTEYGSYAFGDIIQYLDIEVVSGVEAHGINTLAVNRNTEYAYIVGALSKVMTPITLVTEIVNISDAISKQVGKSFIETISLDNILSKAISTIKSEVIKAYQISTRSDIIENGNLAISKYMSEFGSAINNCVTEFGEVDFIGRQINGLQAIISTIKTEHFHVSDSIIKNPLLYKTEKLISSDIMTKSMRAFCTEAIAIFNISVSDFKDLDEYGTLVINNSFTELGAQVYNPLSEIGNWITHCININAVQVEVESIKGETIKINSNVTTPNICVNSLPVEQAVISDILSPWWQWIMTETLAIGDTITHPAVLANLYDVVRIAKDTIPIDPFHDHRINAAIAYNSLQCEVSIISDTIIKQPLTIKTDSLTITDSITKNPIHYLSEAFILIERDIFNLGVRIVKTPFTELLTISVTELYPTFFKYLLERIDFSDTLSHPFLHYLSESILFIDSISRRTASSTIREEITLADSILRGQLYTLSVEILNVAEAHNPTVILAYYNEKLNIIASFMKHPLYWLYEQITVIEAGKTTVREVLNLIEHGESIFSNLSADGNYVFETIDDSGFWKVSHVIYEKPLVSITANLSSELLEVLDTRTTGIAHTIVDSIKVISSISKAGSKYITEQVIIVDSMYDMFGALLIEVIYVGDTVVKNPMVYLSERIYFLDDLISVLGVLLSEVITLGDSLSKVPMKIFIEVVTLPEEIAKDIITTVLEYIKLNQYISKQPMTYRELETVNINSASQISLLAILSIEAVTIASAIDRRVSAYLIESIKVTDERCAKSISFVALETLAIIDLRYASLDRTLQEIVLLSDTRSLSIVLEKLDALRISNTITRGVHITAFNEIITIIKQGTSHEAPDIEITKDASEIVVIDSPIVGNNILSNMQMEVLKINQSMTKRLHEYVLMLETIVISNTTTWYENLLHRLESSIKQSTKTVSQSKVDKEKSVKKQTKDTERE